MKSCPIGILDSGIGGTSVLKEIIKFIPGEEYIYYSDSKNNPYGEKSKEEVANCIEKIIEYFKTRNCKAIVFACNTATALTIDYFREKYQEIIFIGTEPAYKMVNDYAKDKNALVMATSRTIESERFQSLYREYDNHHTTLLPCPGLANAIEEEQDKNIIYLLNKLLLPLKKEKIEVVVLGCTHYSFIKKQISDVLGSVTFFEGNQGIAWQLLNKLKETNIKNDTLKETKIEFIDSSNNPVKEQRFWKFLET